MVRIFNYYKIDEQSTMLTRDNGVDAREFPSISDAIPDKKSPFQNTPHNQT
jgi:hypothetical protein